MPKAKRETILFSCLGSTDPVRGEHDGGMLHIVRHYRPDRIFWYITKEMRLANERDHRFDLALDYFLRQHPDYHPELLPPYYDEREDVSDFDGFYDTFQEQLTALRRQYPEAEILLNVSSGTPQMKTTLALLATTLQFRIRVIQVKNFENRSGSSERTTSRTYDLEIELELNEDNEPDAPNRCVEPRLMLMQRDRLRTQVDALLRRYDYEALVSLSGMLPENTRTLIQHLAYRAAYDTAAAWQEAKKLPKMDLYPMGEPQAPTARAYRELSEYVLVLKLMQRTQRYTDLVIRLNPLVIRLQRAWLEKQGIDFTRWSTTDSQGRESIDPVLIRRDNPALLEWLDAQYYTGFRVGPLNIILCNHLMTWLKQQDSPAGLFFQKLGRLNRERNESAHTLTNFTEKELQKIMGCSGEALIRQLTGLLAELYPQHYKEELFSIYDSANRRIREEL